MTQPIGTSPVLHRYPNLFRRPDTPPVVTVQVGAPAIQPAGTDFAEAWAALERWLQRLQGSLAPAAPRPTPGGQLKDVKKFWFRRDDQFKVYGATGATWLCGTKWDTTTIKNRIAEARKEGATMVFAQYGIPNRDNGGGSGGGAKSLAQYKAWVTANAKAIGDYPSVIVVEPDGLHLGLDAECVKAAVQIYRQHCPNAKIYVDAGHSRWKKPAETAKLLMSGGIEQADGFALNVSAFQWTADNLAYGDQVIAELKKLNPRLSDKQFVIDTSRNGNGPGVDERGKSTWGDPIRAANGGPIMNGPKPTTATGHPNCAAFLWVKGPGHGDNRIRKAGSFGGEAWVKHHPNAPLGPR